MKKITTGTLLGTFLFTSGAFASELNYRSVPEPYIIDEDIEIDTNKNEISTTVKDLIKKYELVIRNNNIRSDYEYNNITYYTSKINSKKLIVPKEIMDSARKIYFLVEEGGSRYFYTNDSMESKVENEIEEVSSEYNYKKVEFSEGKTEYFFNNQDLVKDFGKGEYFNVTITLMAEFSDTEKVPLSNTEYLSINNKINVLTNLKNNQNIDDSYFGYYDTNSLEKYLEEFSKKITRDEYRDMLSKADKKITYLKSENENSKKTILDSISKESDFKNYVDKYAIYTETERLLSSLIGAVKNQLQNIRAFDVIDGIFGK